MTAAAQHWVCLTKGCGAHGETTATESGGDAKHVKGQHHATVTTTSEAAALRMAARCAA